MMDIKARFPFNYNDLPLRASIDRYVQDRTPVGDFLTAILSNDLRGACEQADNVNIHLIPVYMAYLYNETPAACWGSKEQMDYWLNWGDA